MCGPCREFCSPILIIVANAVRTDPVLVLPAPGDSSATALADCPMASIAPVPLIHFLPTSLTLHGASFLFPPVLEPHTAVYYACITGPVAAWRHPSITPLLGLLFSQPTFPCPLTPWSAPYPSRVERVVSRASGAGEVSVAGASLGTGHFLNGRGPGSLSHSVQHPSPEWVAHFSQGPPEPGGCP